MFTRGELILALLCGVIAICVVVLVVAGVYLIRGG